MSLRSTRRSLVGLIDLVYISEGGAFPRRLYRRLNCFFSVYQVIVVDGLVLFVKRREVGREKRSVVLSVARSFYTKKGLFFITA